jgi:hypothetical protein
MLHVAVKHFSTHREIERINAELISTERNRPCREFWKRSGFTEVMDDHFQWKLDQPYPKPTHVELMVGTSS